MSEFLQPPSSSHHHHQLIPLSPSSATAAADAGDSSSSALAASRKPRGRPPGSKNKPKPLIVITKDPTSSMHPVFFHVSPSSDVLDSILSFSRRRHLGVSVLSAAGSVANLSLRHPSVQNSSFTLNGRLEILSLSGFFLPSRSDDDNEASPFTITVAGPNGQVIGGVVAGGLTAASTVVVTAASFVGPEFYRLPLEKEEEATEQEQDETKPEVGMVLGAAVPRAPAPHLHRGSHNHRQHY